MEAFKRGEPEPKRPSPTISSTRPLGNFASYKKRTRNARDSRRDGGSKCGQHRKAKQDQRSVDEIVSEWYEGQRTRERKQSPPQEMSRNVTVWCAHDVLRSTCGVCNPVEGKEAG